MKPLITQAVETVTVLFQLGKNAKKQKWRRAEIFFSLVGMITIFQVIYQTRETVFHRDIQTPRRELKIRRAAEYF